MIIKKIAELFSTVAYIGKINYAPGSFGSLVAFPLCYIIANFVIEKQIIIEFAQFTPVENEIMSIFIVTLAITFILFFLGVYFTSIYIKDKASQDPKEVVIDELVGQMLVIVLSSFSSIMIYGTEVSVFFSPLMFNLVFLFFMPFVLFRLFDIMKPWPISWLDQNIKGATGVMIDDIAAAIAASIVHYMIIFIIIDQTSRI